MGLPCPMAGAYPLVVPKGQPTAPEIASTVRRRFLRDTALSGILLGQVALQSAHHLRGLVADGMAGLRSGTGEGAELSLAGVTQPRHDVTPLVQCAVHGTDMDRHVRMRGREGRHPFGRRDQADLLDPRCSPLLEDVDRCRTG